MSASFQLTTSQMVGLDPGYDLDDVSLLGCVIEPCRQGSWRVQEFPSTSPRMPGPVVALHNSIEHCVAADSSQWREVRDIGGDGGVQGIYDIASFGDEGLIPPDYRPSLDWPEDPDRRWYGFICNTVLAKRDWGVVVHSFGCTMHWDLGCLVSTLSDSDGFVVGVRLQPGPSPGMPLHAQRSMT